MISFNNIPDSIRTPGAYNEIDNSRALQGLIQNPHRALILGQMVNAEGNASRDTLYQITKEGLADGYFGPGSILARMCSVFKKNNPNTELWAMALSTTGGVAASAVIKFSIAMSATGGSVTYAQPVNMLINGSKVAVNLVSGWSVRDVNSAFKVAIDAMSTLPCHASTTTASGLALSAVQSGTPGNYINVRFNYYTGQSNPTFFGDSINITAFAGGTTDPSLTDAWAIIDNTQFHYIIQPYVDAANLTSLENELSSRFGPLVDMQGHGFGAVRGALASCSTLGNSRNSPYNTVVGAYDSPTAPEEWAAALGAIAAKYLNADPARPLQYLMLQGILPPPQENRFTRAERDILLYDGMATWIVDSGGNVMIERSVTTYQTNALGLPDPSYLDVETLATLGEIRYQYKTRMVNRFIIPRFKLADDTFPVQPGSYVATPKTVKQEIIALFSLLRDKGLIENLEDFKDNLVVERNASDRNRVDVLLPPDLVNQFRILAGLIQFIL